MFSKKFLKDAAERAISTGAQVLGAFLVIDVAGGAATGVTPAVSIMDVDWPFALGVTAAAMLGSVLKSLAARKSGVTESASLVPSVGNK